MSKKIILFIGLIVCFLTVLVIFAYVEKCEREEIVEQEEIAEPAPALNNNESPNTDMNRLPVDFRNGTGTAERYKKMKLEKLDIRGEDSLIPSVSLEEWEVSGPFANPENCDENKFFSDMRPAYCSLEGLKDSYSVFWNKNIPTKEKSFMPGTIVASVFEFSDADSIILDDVVNAHNMKLKFLQDFELEGITIQRQEFKYGIRLVSQEEAKKLSEQEITDKTTMIVSYFDIFSLDNVVFTVSYDSNYEDEAKIIEKAIIINNQ